MLSVMLSAMSSTRLSAWASTVLLLPCPQEPAAAVVVGRCTLAGKPAAITAGDVALEMAFHQRRKDEGRAACEHLVNATLVRLEAERQKLWPTAAETEALWQELQRQLRAAGRDPEQEAVVRNSGVQALLADLSVTVAHEKLVRKTLDLRREERVSGDMLKLWLQDARKRIPVVDDPDQLPLGTAARIGEHSLTLLDLGLLLLRTSTAEELDRFLRQVVVLQALDAMAREHGVQVTEAELRQQLEVHRVQALRDPRFQGMSFEQLLQAEGLTPDWLLQSRVFRAQVLQQKLAARLHPRDELLAEIAGQRQQVLDQVGPRRRLGVIFVRALEPPNQLIPRDFAAATAHLEQLRQRLDKGQEAFDVVARIESDDAAGKVRGGDTGWHQRQGGQLPEVVLAAAFALAKDELSAPLRSDQGCYLVKVLGIEPELSDAQLADRLRERYADELMRRLLTDSKIVRADGSPLDGNDRETKGGNGK